MIASISPPSGPANNAATITLTGSGLGASSANLTGASYAVQGTAAGARIRFTNQNTASAPPTIVYNAQNTPTLTLYTRGTDMVPGQQFDFTITVDGVESAVSTATFTTAAIPTYTITYNGNSNTGGAAPSAQTKTQGVNLALAGNTGSLVKTGFTFNGWNTLADGTGTSYAASANYTTDAPLTLFARWTSPPP